MDFITEKFSEWIREILISGIISNLTGMFDTMNQKVGEVAGQVGITPKEWNIGIYNVIHELSENVVLPIAGLILTFVVTLELIQLITDKNNMHDIDTWMFWKWIFKSCCAVCIVTNTWNIVMAVFDMSQQMVMDASGVVSGNTSIDISTIMADLNTKLQAMDTGELFGLWIHSMLIGITIPVLTLLIFVIVNGRMIEIYFLTSMSSVPMATITSRERGQIGDNYLRSLFALGFQAFLIIVCIAIYAVKVQEIAIGDDITAAIWDCLGYTVLLCFSLFMTGPMAKKVLNTH